MSLHRPEPHPEDIGSDVGAEDDDEPVEDHSEGQQAQGQEPEPDEDVNLLIDCKTYCLSLDTFMLVL